MSKLAGDPITTFHTHPYFAKPTRFTALAVIIALLAGEQLTRTNPCPGNRTCPGDPADPPPCESCPCSVGPPGSGHGPAGSASPPIVLALRPWPQAVTLSWGRGQG